MKKLFFTAALAIVAVAGSLTTKAVTYFASGGSPSFDCQPVNPLSCQSISGNIYTTANPDNQDASTRVNKTLLTTSYDPS